MSDPARWSAHSRELTLICDAEGVIVECDARAARLLDARPGVPLLSLAVPGTEQKAQSLLERGAREPLVDWEVPLVSRGRPLTVLCQARPSGTGGVDLHGLVLPEGYGETVRQLGEAMEEVLTLNRELSRQKKELAESNKGMLSLHAEIADKADVLRRTAEVKSRVVANVSHEFRTPLNSILGLSHILTMEADGPLTPEQRKQVGFIRSSAQELSQMINDLLDLAKTEAGKMQVRSDTFTVTEFFAALRGTMRPLLTGVSGVELVIQTPAEDTTLRTDQGKVAQILRNLIANGLKFTERGQVRVTAAKDGELVRFAVADTGIGIPREHLETIFEEFGQVDHAMQRRARGTGLGLSLSRSLAGVLGGTLDVVSEVGKGSTFTLTMPATHPEVREIARMQEQPPDPARAPILVVDDDRKTIFIYERYLANAGFQVLPARTVDEARQLLARRPAAVVLDIMLEGESTWEFLADLKRDPATTEIPVLVVTVTSKAEKARELGADEFWLKPVDQGRLIRRLRSIARPGGDPVLLLSDE